MHSACTIAAAATAIALTLATGGAWADAQTYYWIGSEGGSWTDSSNWSLSPSGPAVSSGYPGGGDTWSDKAIFESAAKVTVNNSLGESKAVGNLQIYGDLTITGTQPLPIAKVNETVHGTYKIILDSGYLQAANTITFPVPIEVKGTSRVDSQNKKILTLSGAITGNGTLNCSSASTSRYVIFTGDLTGFEGKIIYSEFSKSNPFSATCIADGANDFSRSSWTFPTTSAASFFPANADSTLFKFGALYGKVVASESGGGKRAALEIGARDEDSTVTGSWYINGSNANYANAIHWIAPTATLKWSVENTYEMVISKGGTVNITDAKVLSTNFDEKKGFTSPSYLHNTTFHESPQIYFLDKGGYLTVTEAGVDSLNAKIVSTIQDVESTAIVGFSVPENESVTLDLTAKSSTLSAKKFGKKGAGTLTVTGLTNFGDVSIADGPLVLSTGSTIASVTIDDDAELQFAGDPTWEDGAEVTLATFTTTVPDTTEKISVVNLGGRMSANITLDGNSLKANITTQTLVWNGDNNAEWTAANVWTANGVDMTFQKNDVVVFPATQEGETKTVNVTGTVAPVSVTINGNYKFTGTGNIDISSITIAAGASLTIGSTTVYTGNYSLLANGDTKAALIIDVGSGNNYTVGTITPDSKNIVTVASGNMKFSTAPTYMNDKTYQVYIANGATVTLDKTIAFTNYHHLFSGEGTLIIDGVALNGSKCYGSYLLHFTGDVVLTNGGSITLGSRGDSVASQTGSGKLTFAGGTLTDAGTAVAGKSKVTNSSYEIVAGTSNTTGYTIDISKTTIVAGTGVLDNPCTVLTSSVAFTGDESSVTVASELASDGWTAKIVEDSGSYKLILTKYSVTTSEPGTVTAESQAAADAIATATAVKLTNDQLNQGLKASYYKVSAVSTGDNNYNLVAALDKDKVGVEFDAETDEGVTPAALTSGTATFKLKNSVKKGLYYGVGTMTDPNSTTVKVLAEQKAEADGQEITVSSALDFTSSNVLYYKWSVSDTAQITPAAGD